MTPQELKAWMGLLQGQTIGGYLLGDCIGNGNFGLVFEVKSIATGSMFAMKVLLPGAGANEHTEFEREGVLLEKLVKSSHVINLIETGTDTLMVEIGGARAPWPVRFHVLTQASGDLGELIEDPVRLDQLDWTERIALWRDAIKGVHQMHLNGVVHRDLKSDNTLLVVRGSRSEARIADLGRSRDVRQPASGSPDTYLAGRGDRRVGAPEALWFQGGSDAKAFIAADLYGLGSLFVELAVGHPITALAFGSWDQAVNLALTERNQGIQRDLSAFRPHFRRVIDDVVDTLPPAIRDGARRLLLQLCDPVPKARYPVSRFGRPIANQEGLAWLLTRADILSRQLTTAERVRRRYRKERIA